MTTMPQAKAVDRIRAHLDQAQRDGQQPPGRPALIARDAHPSHSHSP